jgi:hypothetical protein
MVGTEMKANDSITTAAVVALEGTTLAGVSTHRL